MSQERLDKILAKPGREWSVEERVFVQGQIKIHGRRKLKERREKLFDKEADRAKRIAKRKPA